MSVPFNIRDAMSEAVAAHQQGRLRDAEKIYARVLKAVPDQFDALNLLGTVKAQQGHIGEAHRLFAAAVKANPGSRAVSVYPQLQNGNATAEVTLLQGMTFKKVTEKLD